MKQTQQTHDAHIQFDVNLWKQIKRMAKENRRTVRAEVQLRLENAVREHFSKGQGK